jgi:diketogulonate reductase-like aldo/keto reductase
MVLDRQLTVLNEPGVALQESGIDRDQVFITTKFLPRAEDPVRAVEQSLRQLGTDYVDLYRADPAYSRSAMCAAARSSGSPRPSARDQ